jgi:site-specific DNA recombinase
MPTNPSQLVRAAIYARVSSEEQREGQTIDSQIAELERFAGAQGWIIGGVYKDEGWSGAVLARPELDRLRDNASKRLFDLVLLNDVDRLARDVSHLGVIKRDLERHGVQVRFRKLPAEQSPTANLMVNILGSFAEFEREMIADRTRRGRRHKVEVRQQYLGSIAPYGYRYVTKDLAAGKEGYLEIIPEQAAVVKQMYQWIDQEGLSARAVVKRLNELRIRPRKGGAAWAKSSVLCILRCETYTGLWHYNKHESYEPPTGSKFEYRRSLKCQLRQRPREEWIPVKLPDELRIIERQQWERVQAQLARNSSFSTRNSKHHYLLKGLVQCGGCQARYVGDPNHGRFYYRCHQRCKRYPTIREEYLNQVVWEAIKGAILKPEIITRQIEERAQEAAANHTQSEREGQQIEQALQKLDEEERRILEAYRLGILTPAVLGRELEQITQRRATLIQRQTELGALSKIPEPAVVCRSILEYCREAAGWIETLNDIERQRLLQLLIDRIIFQGKRVIIQGVIPIQPSASSPGIEDRNQASFSLWRDCAHGNLSP